MPFYRMNGMMVHMRGSRMPKACGASVMVKTPEGTRLEGCFTMSGYLCDWPMGDGKTCDAPLCDAHAQQVAANKHYCPSHHRAHLDSLLQKSLFTSLVES